MAMRWASIVIWTTTARTASRICSADSVGQARQRALAAASSPCKSEASARGAAVQRKPLHRSRIN